VIKIKWFCWALVAQACNPSYSQSRDQEDCGSKAAQANCETLSGKFPIQKNRTGRVTQVVEYLPRKCMALTSNPQYNQNNNNNIIIIMCF
jgi:hypothetical protein